MATKKIVPTKAKPKPKITAKNSTSANKKSSIRLSSKDSKTTKSITDRRKEAATNRSKKKSSRSLRSHNHEKNVFKSKKFRFLQRISKNDLRPGMIISFSYRGDNSHDPLPLVLVLNKRWLGKLHGINLNYCNYKLIILIGRIVNERISPKALTLGLKYKMINPYGFYHVMLKPLLRRYKKSIYRTYFSSKVDQPKLMDYKFKASGVDANTITFYQRDGKTLIRLTKVKPLNIAKRRAARKTTSQVKKVDLNTKNPDRDNISKKDMRNYLADKPDTGLLRRLVDGVKQVNSVPNVKVVKKV